MDWNVKLKYIKNIGETFCNLELGKEFLDFIPKTLFIKEC